MRDAHGRRARARATVAVVRDEVEVVDPTVAGDLLGTRTLGTNACGTVVVHDCVRAGVAITDGVGGLVLRDRRDRDCDRIAVRIGHAHHIDDVHLVVRRPEDRDAGCGRTAVGILVLDQTLGRATVTVRRVAVVALFTRVERSVPALGNVDLDGALCGTAVAVGDVAVVALLGRLQDTVAALDGHELLATCEHVGRARRTVGEADRAGQNAVGDHERQEVAGKAVERFVHGARPVRQRRVGHAGECRMRRHDVGVVVTPDARDTERAELVENRNGRTRQGIVVVAGETHVETRLAGDVTRKGNAAVGHGVTARELMKHGIRAVHDDVSVDHRRPHHPIGDGRVDVRSGADAAAGRITKHECSVGRELGRGHR